MRLLTGIWVRPLEVVDADGVGIGKWRLYQERLGGAGPYRLCNHQHGSPADAWGCHEALARITYATKCPCDREGVVTA